MVKIMVNIPMMYSLVALIVIIGLVVFLVNGNSSRSTALADDCARQGGRYVGYGICRYDLTDGTICYTGGSIVQFSCVDKAASFQEVI